MAEYSWPSNIPIASASFRQIDGDKVFESKLSGTVRTAEGPPPYWVASLGFTNLTASNGQRLEAYLWRIGKRNRALVPMTDYIRQGAGGGTPRVKGGSQTGLTLLTDGWPASTTVLLDGDRFSVSGQAFAIVSDATSDGTGNATLTLSSGIRTAPADNALLEIDTPTVRCILKGTFGMDTRPGRFKNGIVEFREAVP